jgi:hypothetical protein
VCVPDPDAALESADLVVLVQDHTCYDVDRFAKEARDP